MSKFEKKIVFTVVILGALIIGMVTRWSWVQCHRPLALAWYRPDMTIKVFLIDEGNTNFTPIINWVGVVR
jgi:hypothetical protein